MEVRALYRRLKPWLHVQLLHATFACNNCTCNHGISCRWLRVATLATVRSGRRWLGAVVRALRVQWGLSQTGVRVDCGLSYTTVQATIAQNGSYFLIPCLMCQLSCGNSGVVIVVIPSVLYAAS